MDNSIDFFCTHESISVGANTTSRGYFQGILRPRSRFVMEIPTLQRTTHLLTHEPAMGRQIKEVGITVKLGFVCVHRLTKHYTTRRRHTSLSYHQTLTSVHYTLSVSLFATVILS